MVSDPQPSSPAANRRQHYCFAFHGVETVGAERSLLALAEAAHAQGNRVTLVLPRRGRVNALIAERIPDADVRYCPNQWWLGNRHRGLRGVALTCQALLHTASWVGTIRSVAPSIVVAGSTVAPAPILAARLTGTPVVVLLSESIRTNPTLMSVIPKELIIRVIRRAAACTVAVSRYAERQYGGATMVAYPVLDRPTGLIPAQQSERHAEGGALRVVMLGTLSVEKGQSDAIEAVRRLVADGVDVRLDLYGDAEPVDLAALQTEIVDAGLGRIVRHRGTTDDPLSALASADVSVVCSGNEAYGRVTAESVMVGTPVVAYDAGASGEVLSAGGGMLVLPSPAALADALRLLVRTPAVYDALKAEAVCRATAHASFGDAEETLDRILTALAERDA